MSVCPGTSSLLCEWSPKVHKQKKRKKSVRCLVTHNTVSGYIVELFCPEFVICYQSPLVSLNRRLFGRRKLGGGGATLQSVFFFFFVCCFLPVSEECWNSSDLPQHLSELRATEGLSQAVAGFPAGLFSWGGAAGQAPPRNSSWKGAALLLTDALYLLRSSSFYCSFYTSFSENHLFKVIGSL